MTGNPHGTGCRTGLWAVLACFGLAVSVMGGVVSPLYVGNVSPVLDEYGRPMPGSEVLGEGSRVELRTATDGYIRPPLISGAPHPYNPLLQSNSITAMGIGASRPDSGIFALVLSNRPTAGTPVFGRVFNAPTIEEASFYADSAMAASPTYGTSLILTFSSAVALDTNDADGDGLNNSWEKVLGTDDRMTPDYDGDGMPDLHEMLAGTGATDPDSLLSFRTILSEDESELKDPDNGSVVRVQWQSVPGKQYQLQYVPTLLGVQNFIPVPGVGDTNGVITAAEGEYEIELLVDLPEGTAAGAFRVRLIHDGVEP